MEAFSSGLFKTVGAKVRQLAFNLTETEIMVEDATNGDPWGPHGAAMSEIANLCFDPAKQKEVMQVLARRLTDTGEEWRHVYKSLLLLEFLVKQGPMKVVYEMQGNLSFLEELQRFEYKDKNGKDHGLNVRNRAKELAALVSNQERVLAERDAAQKNKSKYSGVSKEDMMFASRTTPKDDSFGKFGYSGIELKNAQANAVESPHSNLSDDNPFEATRRRIEKLKEQEEQSVGKSGRNSLGVAGPLSGTVPGKKEPKKLSQVKVNPEIAAAFQKLNITPTVKAQQVESRTGVSAIDDDLLGGLDDPPKNAENTLGGLDALGDLLPTNAAGTEENGGWSTFESGTAFPQQAPPQQEQDPFALMAGGPMPATVQTGSSDPLSGLVGTSGQDLLDSTLAPQSPQQPPAALPDFFASPAPMQNAQAPLGGTGISGFPGMQPESFSFQQPLGGMDAGSPMLSPGVNPPMVGDPSFSQGNTFQGMGVQGLAGSMQGFQQSPTALGSAQGMMQGGLGMPGATANAFAVQPALMSHVSKETTTSSLGSQNSSAPMRPGAVRPVANRKKDPFADLAVL